ncbi:restriction endonuclease subunit S [Clostridium sp. DJ247]|uniref:restriction endonuclease subunit S n=1 Tax=Clostridium sp. DJ247 TaxID=2726188 RepID=UPI00162940FE|nr:restriction endonuclease subunit S [Clostridium sp. DJ247]MBC2582283.1 hypothetical protein [Clostridium sp. DJ247]
MAKVKKEKLPLEELLEQAIVKEEDRPYEVPGNWVWTRLENILEVVMGQSPSGSDTTEDARYTPLIGGAADMGLLYPNAKRYTMKPTKLSKLDDVIVSIRATLGRPIFSDGEYCLGRGVCAIRSNVVGRKLIRYFFLNFENYLYEISTGTTFAQVSKNDIENMPFPLPPIIEQQRIVDVIESLFEKLDTAKELVQNALDSFESRKAAILRKAFSGKLTKRIDSESIEWIFDSIIHVRDELVKNRVIQRPKKIAPIEEEDRNNSFPHEWKLCKLGEIAFVTKLAGFEYTKYIHLREEGDIPVVRAQNVRKGYLDTKNLLYIDEEVSKQLSRSALNRKSILVTFIGAGIGDVCLFNEPQRFHLAPNVAKVEIYNDNEEYILHEYVLYYLISQAGQKQIFKYLKATAQPSLSMETIRNIVVPIPSLSEQKEIVRILENLLENEQRAKELCDTIEKIDLMKKSILAKAFRGELETNNPEEESAVELLKEVLKEKIV